MVAVMIHALFTMTYFHNKSIGLHVSLSVSYHVIAYIFLHLDLILIFTVGSCLLLQLKRKSSIDKESAKEFLFTAEYFLLGPPYSFLREGGSRNLPRQEVSLLNQRDLLFIFTALPVKLCLCYRNVI